MCVRFFWRSMSESLFSHFVWLMVLSCRRGPWGLNAFYDESHSRTIFIGNLFWQSNNNSLFIYFTATVNIRERPWDILRLGNTCAGCVLCACTQLHTQHVLIINNALIIRQNQQCAKDLWSFVLILQYLQRYLRCLNSFEIEPPGKLPRNKYLYS